MPVELQIRCDCKTVQGTAFDISPNAGSHVKCFCKDCQAFAHFLKKADHVLDAQGGSDIFQMSQGRVVFTSGANQLTCMRLTPEGLVRWYSRCCNAPIGNTMATSSLPFVGMVAACLSNPDGASASEQLGPIIAHVYRKFAKGDPALVPPNRMAMPYVLLRAVVLLLRWKLRGDSKRSAFFNPATNELRAAPRVLSPAERAALALLVAGAPVPSVTQAQAQRQPVKP